jgi:tRNA A37 threonylcarbamoyltransferase TsaD
MSLALVAFLPVGPFVVNQVLSKAEYEKAKATPIDEGLVPLKASDDNRKVVDNYVKEVINEVKLETQRIDHC